MKKVFDSQTADGNSTAIVWHGGYGTVIVAGTWGGGTVKLRATPDGATWIDVGLDVEFTADGMGNFQLPAGLQLRLTLAGATNPDLDAWIG
jgi:hypothetical protein